MCVSSRFLCTDPGACQRLTLLLHPCPAWGASTSDLLVCLSKNLCILCWRLYTKLWKFQMFDTSMVYLRTVTYSKSTWKLLSKYLSSYCMLYKLSLFSPQYILFFYFEKVEFTLVQKDWNSEKLIVKCLFAVCLCFVWLLSSPPSPSFFPLSLSFSFVFFIAFCFVLYWKGGSLI